MFNVLVVEDDKEMIYDNFGKYQIDLENNNDINVLYIIILPESLFVLTRWFRHWWQHGWPAWKLQAPVRWEAFHQWQALRIGFCFQSPQQKALLNRKGNVLFNQGQIDSARRIFTTTGYSDGLTRVGDRFAAENNELGALKQYILAHNKSKTEPIYEKLAKIISILLKE